MDPEALEERLRLTLARGSDGVLSAYLFGSHASAAAHRESDVDVGVLLDRRRHPTASARFERKLLLFGELSRALPGMELDIVVLNDAPPGLARRIVLDGRRLSCSDPESDHAFRRDAQLRAADLEPFLRRARMQKLSALAE